MKHIILLISICTLTVAFGQDKKITVEKIWKYYSFNSAGVAGFRSMNDGNYFSKTTQTSEGISVTKHKFSDYEGEGETIIPASLLKEIGMDDYSFNADESKALITTQTQPIYRRSYSAVHYLIDLKEQTVQPLDEERQPQTLAEYSPDGTKVSYIYENNIYVKDIATGEIRQLTHDGEKNKVINGTTDWVYEEEFAITKAYGWSPDSEYIAFLRFDESDVREYTMKYFYDLYPNMYTFKYPKAGEDNSKVTAHLVSFYGKIRNIELGEYEYIPRLKWSSTENKLVLQTLNRHQNELKYHLMTLEGTEMSVKTFYTEKSDTYVEIDDNLLILDDGKTILRTSEKDGYNHIYALTFDGKSRAVTSGNWDVIDCYGIDAKDMVYYSSAEAGAIHQSIHKIRLDGKKKTCISEMKGTSEADFSNGMKYFIKTYSTANTPPIYTLCDSNGKEIVVMEDNQALVEKLASYNLSKKDFVKFKGHEMELNGWMIKPADFDPNKKYPVYIHIYGGPGSNTVSDSWGGFNLMY
ncbi:MAG: DPP IV N-terminal domain-containing protein [Fluviicola sp.]